MKMIQGEDYDDYKAKLNKLSRNNKVATIIAFIIVLFNLIVIIYNLS